MQKRQPVKEDKRKPIGTNARGGGKLADPHVIRDRDNIRAVRAYEPGHKGKQQKAKGPWHQR
jgi:hypothetical protein